MSGDKNYLNYIDSNCHKFDESVALAEVAWNNIIMASMNEEYTYLQEGIASKFLNTIKGFFAKMGSWIKGRFSDLKNFSNRTLVKMDIVFNKIAKFAEENQDKILEGAKTKEAKASILDWYPKLIKLSDMLKALEKLKFTDEFESIIEDTKKFMDSQFKSNSIIETKIDMNLAKIAISNAIESKNIKDTITKYVKAAEDALRETETAVNNGLKAKNDENLIIESKNAIEAGKKKILTTSKKTSILINLANKAIVDSHRINVACATMYTG